MNIGKYLRRIWELLYPMALYYFIQLVVVNVGVIGMISFFQIKEAGLTSQEAFEMTKQHLLLLNLLASLVALPVFVHLYHVDLKKRNIFRNEYEITLLLKFFWIVPFGIVGMFWANYVVSFLSLFMPDFMLNSYEETKGIIFDAPVRLQILASALLAPAVEELIFRGLIYNRLKQYLSIKTAAVFSAILFGLYHMNWIQIPYAFLIGIMAVFIYEKYQTIYACIFFHGTANLFSVLVAMMNYGQSQTAENEMTFAQQCAGLLILIGFSGIIQCVISWLINKRVNEKEKSEHEIINDYDSML